VFKCLRENSLFYSGNYCHYPVSLWLLLLLETFKHKVWRRSLIFTDHELNDWGRVTDRNKADSYIEYRAHAVPLPCRAAKDLECVFPIWFTQCGRVWFTLAMPCPCRVHAMLWPCSSSQEHSTAQRWETDCGLPDRSRLLPATTRSSTKVVIRSIPILLTTIHTYYCKEW
jgi:hypothetical protein